MGEDKSAVILLKHSNRRGVPFDLRKTGYALAVGTPIDDSVSTQQSTPALIERDNYQNSLNSLTLGAAMKNIDEADAPVLSVVLPMFNEQGNLQQLVARICIAMDKGGDSYEIVAVDDGSNDHTWRELVELSSNFHCLRAVKLARNFGHQAALMAGLARSRGQAVISMDADLQHPPELLPELISAWKNGAVVVETNRTYNLQAGWFKKTSSNAFYNLFSYMAGIKLSKGRSDFRLLDRSVVREILKFRQNEIFMRGMVGWLNFPTQSVDFQAADRLHGESKYNLSRMLSFAQSGIVGFSTKPLRIGIALGVLTSFFAFIALIYILIRYIQGETVSGWASTLGLLSLLFGVLFLILGIIGSYIAQIYLMLQNRPPFVIHEEIDPGQKIRPYPILKNG